MIRERHRRDHRAAQALHRARRDQQGLRVRQAAGQRSQGEQRDARQEQPAVPEQVAQPAAQQQEAAEGEHVGIDHPDQRGLAEAEVGADRGKGDVHDRGVEHDHEHAQAQDHQRQPAAAPFDVFSVAHMRDFVLGVNRRESRSSDWRRCR
jgi:hypothetical protein